MHVHIYIQKKQLAVTFLWPLNTLIVIYCLLLVYERKGDDGSSTLRFSRYTTEKYDEQRNYFCS